MYTFDWYKEAEAAYKQFAKDNYVLDIMWGVVGMLFFFMFLLLSILVFTPQGMPLN